MLSLCTAARSAAAFLVFSLLIAGGLLAQSERGTIAGNVVDPSGAAVPGAKVTVVNKATNVTAPSTSNEAGAYVVPNLSPGEYSVRVEHAGFKASMITGIVLNAASSIRADITLEVGVTQQTIEVSAEAAALQTDNAKSSTVVTNKLVDELPTVVGGAMRSPFDLAILTPESKNFGDNNFQMGGGQAASFGVTLDGVSANTTRALSNSWVAVNTPSLKRSPSSRWKPTASRPNTATPAAASDLRLQVRHQRVARLGVRVPAQHEARRQRLVRQRQQQPAQGLQAERLRRQRRRAGVDSEDLQRPGQDVLLLLL